MAILWEKRAGADHYQVRTAGNTRRLYTNGVFHSQYNPRNPVDGSVWDLLMLPAFFLPQGSIKRVLVLGVGGGAVIKQLEYFLSCEHITGVELNPVHLTIARRYFDVKGRHIELVEADARQWLEDYRGPKFDLIVDDLFGEQDGEPVRVFAADRHWMTALKNRLTGSGVLVMNFDSTIGFNSAACFHTTSVNRFFPSVYRFTTPRYENIIGAFFRKPVEKQQLYNHLSQYPALNMERKSCRLNFEVRKIAT